MEQILIEGYLKLDDTHKEVEINIDLISSSLNIRGLGKSAINSKDVKIPDINGIYILESEDICYVGQSKNLKKRLTTHKGTDKIEFLRCFILSHANDIRGYLDFMEAYSIKELLSQGYNLSNDIILDPDLDNLSPSKKQVAMKWIKEFLAFLPMLGFRKKANKQPTLKPVNIVFPPKSIQKKEIKCFLSLQRMKAINCMATGILTTEVNSLKILKGSTGCWVPSKDQEEYKNLFEKQNTFLKNKLIINDDKQLGSFIFLQDVKFSSPSEASRFIMGTSANGWVTWKDNDKEKINKYRNKV